MEPKKKDRPAFAAFSAAAGQAMTTKERRGAHHCTHEGWKLEVMVRRPIREDLPREIPGNAYFWGIRFQILHRVDMEAAVKGGDYTEATVEEAAKGYLFRAWKFAEAMTTPTLDLAAPLAAYNRPPEQPGRRYWWAPETWRTGLADQFFKRNGKFLQMHWCIMTWDIPRIVIHL